MAVCKEFLEKEKSNARPLEPTMVSLLREVELLEEMMMAFRVHGIFDRELMVVYGVVPQKVLSTRRHGYTAARHARGEGTYHTVQTALRNASCRQRMTEPVFLQVARREVTGDTLFFKNAASNIWCPGLAKGQDEDGKLTIHFLCEKGQREATVLPEHIKDFVRKEPIPELKADDLVQVWSVSQSKLVDASVMQVATENVTVDANGTDRVMKPGSVQVQFQTKDGLGFKWIEPDNIPLYLMKVPAVEQTFVHNDVVSSWYRKECLWKPAVVVEVLKEAKNGQEKGAVKVKYESGTEWVRADLVSTHLKKDGQKPTNACTIC